MKNLSNDVIVHKKQAGIEYIQFKRLLMYPEIEHCYTMRHNGMDFLTYENDNILQSSYDKICEILKFNRENIVRPCQNHTDKIEIVKLGTEKFKETDGVLTDKNKITLCTISADCISLFFYDPVKKVIGNVHSGWRGTLQKISKKAVEKMIEQYGCHSKDIICCMCPHIGKCHFEVEYDVAKLFYETFAYMDNINEIILKKQNTNNEKVDKYFIDTTMINKNILEDLGLKKENIIDSGICTVCENKNFYSYRVEGNGAGRNGALIGLK